MRGIGDHDDSVNMIRHDDKRIQFNHRETMRNVLPTTPGDFARIVQMHLAVDHMAEQACVFPRAHLHEIRPRLGVIISIQAGGTPMVFVRVVFHSSSGSTGTPAAATISNRETSCQPRFRYMEAPQRHGITTPGGSLFEVSDYTLLDDGMLEGHGVAIVRPQHSGPSWEASWMLCKGVAASRSGCSLGMRNTTLSQALGISLYQLPVMVSVYGESDRHGK
jgi:hypothetical protein